MLCLKLTIEQGRRIRQLRLAEVGSEAGRRDTVPSRLKDGDCLALGYSIIWNVVNECSDTKVECFPGIRTEQQRNY